MRRVLLLAAALAVSACAKKPALNRSEPMGDRLAEAPPVGDVPVHGHVVTVEARARDVTGELLGIDAASVWVLEEVDGGRGRPVAVPRRDVRRVGLVAYDAGTATTAGWAVAGTVSTVTHGVFLIFSAPIWMAVGIGTSLDEGLSNDIEVGPDGLDALSQYARFPQGMSSELLRALTATRSGRGR